MNHRTLVVAMSVLLICTPALADVGCVQTELVRIGLDPGPVDGQLGRKTLSAARAFQEGAPYLQDLTVDTSYDWCKALKEQPALASFNSNQGLGGLGTVFDPAMDTTPVLGQTPEYQVPNWVNNPR